MYGAAVYAGPILESVNMTAMIPFDGIAFLPSKVEIKI